MLYNQTFNLDQVAFASEGIKDAQQTVCPTECPILIFCNFYFIIVPYHAVGYEILKDCCHLLGVLILNLPNFNQCQTDCPN